MDLVSSLQSLGDYQSLLTPPQSVIPAANQAAVKAMMFTSGVNVSSCSYFDLVNMKDMAVNFCKYQGVFLRCLLSNSYLTACFCKTFECLFCYGVLRNKKSKLNIAENVLIWQLETCTI